MMNSKTTNLRLSVCAVAVTLCVGGAAPLYAQLTTVGVLNPNPNSLTIQDSPNNTGNANFLTQANMSVSVANAFNNDQGGVINWDTANGWTSGFNGALSYTVSYGTSQSQLLTITRADGNPNYTFGPNNDTPTLVTSGDAYLGFQNNGTPVTWTFDKGLSAWGITEINRFASRDVTFSFKLADNTVINYALQNQNPTGDNSGPLNWFGFQASDANPLVQVSFVASGFARFDDMAFVVAAPVPEPGTMALAAMGGAALLFLRRRRN